MAGGAVKRYGWPLVLIGLALVAYVVIVVVML
jgi:hypothetical protein